MDLKPYIETLGTEFGVAAAAGGPETRAMVERLVGPLESAIRLTLLETLSAATDEITRDLAPGSVHVRLTGREPAFVVDVPRAVAEPRPKTPAPPVVAPEGEDGDTSRINLRLPDHLKAGAESAAARAGLSMNAWLVRAVAISLETGAETVRPAPRFDSGRGQRITGRVR